MTDVERVGEEGLNAKIEICAQLASTKRSENRFNLHEVEAS